MQLLKSQLVVIAMGLLFAALVLVSPEAVTTTAHAGELDLSDAQNAKLARHKVRQRVDKNKAQKDYSVGGDDEEQSDSEDCGTVDIGNVVNQGGFGGPKKIDVIITGDIINANNKCD